MSNHRFFVDCHVFDGNPQGTTSYLKGLYGELIKDKNKTFYLAARDIKNLELNFGNHENVIYLQYSSKYKYYRLLIDIPILILKNKINYAHFQYIVPPVKFCKYIVTIHDVLFLDFPQYFPKIYKLKNRLLFKMSAKNSEIVLTVSEYSKKQIQKHFKVIINGITPNSIDSKYFEEYDKSEIKEFVKKKYNLQNYFLFVSRWEPRKNHYLLLKTFVEYQYYKSNKLVFVGKQAIECKLYNNYYQTLNNEIKNQIVVFSEMNFDQLLCITRASNLFIYPSFAEGFGIPPLESIATLIPTICSNTTAMSDFQFLDDCLFDPNSIEDMNKKIQIALKDINLQKKRDFVFENYNWETASKNFNKCIF